MKPAEAIPYGHSAREPALGPALRATRRAKGLSLASVAAATGISRSLLSLIETGKSDVTVGRLTRLAALYGVRITDLLPEAPHDDPAVVRRKERQLVHSPEEGLDVHLLIPDGERRMVPVVGVWAPGAEMSEFISFDGEQFVLVLEGSVRVEFEGSQAIVLKKGDSVYYTASRPHRWSNAGTRLARTVEVSTRPSS